MDAETSECQGGAGPKCIAKRQITKDRRHDLDIAEEVVRQLKPEERANGKLKRAAELIAFFGKTELSVAERGWHFCVRSSRHSSAKR